jgi:hypothetical protein
MLRKKRKNHLSLFKKTIGGVRSFKKRKEGEAGPLAPKPSLLRLAGSHVTRVTEPVAGNDGRLLFAPPSL